MIVPCFISLIRLRLERSWAGTAGGGEGGAEAAGGCLGISPFTEFYFRSLSPCGLSTWASLGFLSQGSLRALRLLSG